MSRTLAGALSKVPEVTLGFWIIKILATTLGETGGDSVTMSMNLGYAVGSFIFLGVFVVAVIAQIAAKKFHPFLYWITIVATTTLGTTMADYVDRSLGVGYFGGSSILLAGLIASLAVWRWSEGSISVDTVATPRVEMFYWVAILFSQTLGTALGDWMADTNGIGYEAGAVVFAAGLAAVAAAYYYTSISRTLLFWAAFILTRPLGATLGDLARQAARSRRPGHQPLSGLGRPRGGHRRAHPRRSAAGRRSSGRSRAGGVRRKTGPPIAIFRPVAAVDWPPVAIWRKSRRRESGSGNAGKRGRISGGVRAFAGLTRTPRGRTGDLAATKSVPPTRGGSDVRSRSGSHAVIVQDRARALGDVVPISAPISGAGAVRAVHGL